MAKSRRVSRRGLMVGVGGLGIVGTAVAAVGVQQGVLPGRPGVQGVLGLNGAVGEVPEIEPGPVVTGTLDSVHRPGTVTDWAVIRPPGTSGPLPVVVALHGLGDSVESLLGDEFGLPQFLAAAVRDGVAPFAIAAVDGGLSHWHADGKGTDTGAMLVDDFLPLLADEGLLTDRIAMIGWSMGGYGALRLSALLGPQRVGAVVAVSPALWDDAGDAAASGFATAQEYDEFWIMDDQRDLDGIPVRVECGTGDEFYRPSQHYVEGFGTGSDVEHSFEPGAHGGEYWRRVLPGDLRFLGARVGSGHG